MLGPRWGKNAFNFEGLPSGPQPLRNLSRLPHGKAKRHRVARTLGHSQRTLARKLADEGTTYEQVLDDLRQSLALQYIKEHGVSLSQVAWLLGYEGSTSFNHAFKRWTGQSPSAARNQKQLPAPG